ncbi:MAG: glycosyltransferase family 4 protein [Candidatus Marinimicrobia bacterium]|nr:glycosyltransferase family 4 protein [Candidatus Neomarinimicrobiota bacterium]MBL7067592.1 glycosyltransferase family 4 protein [Candidatus Neomarinimicrobiota bacterium]
MTNLRLKIKNQKLKITFILPGFISIPMGGVKVVHEYANQLSRKGHDITLVYPEQLQINLLYRFKKQVVKRYDALFGTERNLYYTPDPTVKVLVIKRIRAKYIPNGDAVIAVGWQTVEQVYKLPTVCGRKFYFLQSFETYFKNSKRILSTYHLPLIKITISQWIIDQLSAIGEHAEGPLGNAINDNDFFIESGNNERPIDIMMLYHPARIKGANEALAVLKTLKKQQPNLNVTMVTARRPVHLIPSWIKLEIRPTLEKLRFLYNSTKIFLHTSFWEGWPLPPMEAMACGCAIVAYRNRGVMEYLIHDVNALLAPIGDRKTLISQLNQLLQDAHRREKLAKQGLKTVHQFSWESSVSKFEDIILKDA